MHVLEVGAAAVAAGGGGGRVAAGAEAEEVVVPPWIVHRLCATLRRAQPERRFEAAFDRRAGTEAFNALFTPHGRRAARQVSSRPPRPPARGRRPAPFAAWRKVIGSELTPAAESQNRRRRQRLR